MALVEVQDVSRIYGEVPAEVRALDHVSLEFEEQSFTAVVGPSGSGKTTLLNLIGCLDKPSEGSVRVDGTAVETLAFKEAARFRGERIGFIFQSFNLLPVLTVFENVEYPLLMVRQTPEAERQERVMGNLEAVGMADRSSGRPWRAPWSPIPCWSWPTSPPPISTPSRPGGCWSSCTGCGTR